MIEMKNVRKRLGKFNMEQIDLQLPDGYIMELVGTNGSGKTTLIHLLLGLYQQDSGTIRIDGRSFQEEERSIREDIGYVLQDNLFESSISVCKNMDYYGKYYSRYDKELCRNYLEQFGVDGRKKCRVLSKGEQLKIQLAFALAHKPKYLILDEPAGNFDPEFAEIFYRLLQKFVSDGAHSVLISTHQTEGMERITDYVTFLQKGKIVFSESIEVLHSSYKMLSGEKYKINLSPKEQIIYIEENAYGVRALARTSRIYPFDAELLVEDASIEDFMYFITKGGSV